MTKKWIYDEDDEPRLFYGDEDFNGSAYPCNDSVFMEIIANKLNELEEENRRLKSENKLLKQDLEHCANQFKDDGKNVLLGLK